MVSTSPMVNGSAAVEVSSRIVWLAMSLIVGAPFTVALTTLLLLPGVGSVVVAATVTVLVMIVPPAVAEPTCTRTSKVACSPAATDAFEKTTLPVPPNAGALVVQPLPVVTFAEKNVVLAGAGMVAVADEASLGPLFLTRTM